MCVIMSIVLVVKYNFSFVFKESRKWAIRSFHLMLYFFIQVNSKLDVNVQSVTMIIV